MVEIIEKYFVLCNEKVLFQQNIFTFYSRVVFQQSTFYLYYVTFSEYFFYFVTKYWNKVTTPALTTFATINISGRGYV